MICFDKLNGYWEEGYHYYVEIRGDRINVLDYHRRPTLATTFKCDVRALKHDRPAELTLADNVLSRAANGEPMTMIRRLTFEDGELKMLYYYTIMGETEYVLHKVDHGPFDHLEILDDKYLPALRGEWREWSKSGRSDGVLIFDGDLMSYCFSGALPVIKERIHVIRVKGSPGPALITPADLSKRDFGVMQELSIEGNMLTTRIHVCDASVPLTVFAREKDLATLAVPPEALEPVRNTMLPR